MSQHEVPTHLNVEDRVIFGLTARQFLYMLVGSSTTYALWDQLGTLPTPARAACVGLCMAVTLAFALLRLGGRSLEEWLFAALLYGSTARRSTWQPREPQASDWRPVGSGWQELVPAAVWAEDERK